MAEGKKARHLAGGGGQAAVVVPGVAAKRSCCGHILLRLSKGFALLALFSCLCLYPLQLDMPPEKIDEWLDVLPGGSLGWLASLLGPMLRFEMTPLVLKESVATVLLWVSIGFAATFLLPGKCTFSSRVNWKRCLFPLVGWLWIFLAAFRAPHAGLDSGWTDTLVVFSVWSLFAWMFHQIPAGKRWERAIVLSVVASVAVVMGVSAAQATPGISKVVFKVMNDWAGPYQRNLYGSLIGHNTGVANICLSAFFLMLGMLISEKCWWRKAIWGALVLLAVYVFAVTKSRFVWLFLVPLVLLFLIGMPKVMGKRLPWKRLVCGVAVCVVFLLGAFALRSGQEWREERSDYIGRMKSIRPSVLLEGTRLRTLAVSGGIVAEKPIVGHGLGGFSVLYPEAQARYFEKYPDSRLRPSEPLTKRAHNDYLQLLVETGLIGLTLVLLSGAFLFRAGWRNFKRVQDGRSRVYRYGALFGMVAILLNAFVDFPFHIAPIAILFIFYSYIFLHREGDGGEDGGEWVAWDKPGVKIARLVLLVVVWILLIPVSLWASKRLQSDNHFKRGDNYFIDGSDSYYLSRPNLRLEIFRAARGHLSLALELQPGHFEAILRQGQCAFALAEVLLSQAQDAQAEGDRTEAVRDHAEAIEMNNESLRLFTAALGMVREGRGESRGNHMIFHILAENYALRKRLNPSDKEAAVQELEYRRKALRYCPAAANLAFSLLNILSPTDMKLRDERQEVVRYLDRYNREVLLSQYQTKANFLSTEGEPDSARLFLEELTRSVPEASAYGDVYYQLCKVHLLRQDVAAFEKTLLEIKRRVPEYPFIAQLDFIRAVRRGEWDRAETIIRPLLEALKQRDQYWHYAYSIVLARLGRGDEARALDATLLKESKWLSQTFALRAEVWRIIVGNETQAMAEYLKAIDSVPGLYFAQECLPLLKHQADTGDWAGVDRTLRFAEPSMQSSPGLRILRDKILRARGNSGRNGTKASK